MISFIYGANTYAATQAVADRLAQYGADSIERFEGSELTPSQLPDIFQGMSLFASQRLIIIKEPASNKALWDSLVDWLDKISEEIEVILIEVAPDKRTKTFKALQKQATTVVCEDLNEVQAIEWLKQVAKKDGSELTTPAARLLVEYVGTDQWRLGHELEKLLLVEDTSIERIKITVEPQPQASVFALLDAALAGRVGEMRSLLIQCETLEDPYRLFGLLANQVFQLAVVSQAEGKTAEAIAKDIGAHPYPIKKLQAVARRLTKQEVSRVVTAVAHLDDQMKRTVAEPWLLIEQALVNIATK